MNRAPLEQWLRQLEALHPTEIELGLERVAAVAGELGLLPVNQPVVTVAGTNGKGSTVAVLEALLQEAGYRTGAFTSPHLLRFNERIRIGGIDAPDAEIVEAFAAIDRARGGISLTYFEFATLAALLIFKSRKVEILILEVGLGGRLDAVNIVDPSVAVITSIDLDHQGWLGETRGEISLEKAGIIRRFRPVVIADPDPPPELRDRVAQMEASPALYLGRDFTMAITQGTWHAELRQADGLPRQLGLQQCGSLLPENICAAVQAALLLGIEFSDDCLSRALEKAAPVGRRQFRKVFGRDYVLDVAHNPASVRKLLDYLNVADCNGKTFCIFSIMADKDIQSVIAEAVGHFDAWFLADQPGNARAASAADIAALLSAAGQTTISISKNLRQAFRRAQAVASKGDRLVVFGSFYTVAGVLPLLNGDNNKGEAS